MTKHDKCRKAAAKSMAALRKQYGLIKMTVRSRSGGKYAVSNMYGSIWGGKACCKWRARVEAAKILAARGYGKPVHSVWDGVRYDKNHSHRW